MPQRLNNFYRLIHGNCLNVLPTLENESIDLVFVDPPYGVTKNKEDVPIDLEKLWHVLKPKIKKNTPIIFTSQFPYTLDIVNSNKKQFRYDLIWDKILSTGFLNASKMPLRTHETILVFYDKAPTYNPQFTEGNKSHGKKVLSRVNRNYGNINKVVDNSEIYGRNKFPVSILSFMKPHPSIASHPTQKPVSLLEYLIKTYSDKYDVVLDPCIGSGTTMKASQNLERNCIGIDIQQNNCNIVKEHCFGRTFLDREVEYVYEVGEGVVCP